ncbi:MAG: acriflavin resistance protein [Planctomycetes bacterium SM23_65]|nr:MAG: acriflavin resistance protein [Planctomycetes bacterium SM23_65]
MKLSWFAVHRPVFTSMLVSIIIILGLVSFVRLPIDLMPDITYPTLSISADYENASPEEIEELVTRPIEQVMSAVPGVEKVLSYSTEGSSNVRVSFSWGTDLDAAANDVRDRLDRAVARLPEDVERPRLRKFDLASFPILILGASSKLGPRELRRIIDDQVKYRIERIRGVAALDVWGGLEREIRVNLHRDLILALGLPLDQILERIEAGNVALPAGTIERGNYEVSVRTRGEYTSLDELRNTVVAIREGVPIRLQQVATVDDTYQKVTRIVRIDGKPGVRLSISKQSGKNTVEVAREVLHEVDRINRDTPQIRLTPMIDSSDYIQRSIRNVRQSALYGGLLAVLVLLFFLRNLRSTFIIALVIPISIIATFTLIYFGGFTLNIMTLGGLALGVGMLVDNAIVVLENIYRLREEGQNSEQAALNGSDEVSSAVIASTLTTCAVFLPLVFVRGMAGVMFKQLAYVIAFALLCSLVLALSLVPMLASRILPRTGRPISSGETWGHRVFRITGGFFAAMGDGYKNLLHFALNHRLLVVVGSLLLLGGSVALIPRVGVEFMPSADEGEARVDAEMDVGTRLDVLDRKFQQIEAIVNEAVPELKNVVASMGGASWRGTGSHTGRIRIALKPLSERKRSSEEVAAVLRSRLSDIPGMKIRTRAGEGFFLLNRMMGGGTERVQVEIRGYDLETADALAERVRKVVESVDGVTDALVSRETGSPEELILVDRQKAADMKLTVSHVAAMLQTVLSGTRASDYREAGKEYRILVKLEKAEQMKLADLLDLTVTNAEGQPVVLRNVVDVRPRTGPVRVERCDQERIVTVSANITERDLGSILKDIREGLRSVPVPAEFAIVFGGDYEEQQKAFRELLLSFVLALVLVYMVMACQFESLRDPFVVMFSVPLAVIGVVLMLFLTRTTFNVQSYIGCIMLGGIVVNNAILLVDHTNLLRRRDGMPLREAVEEAGRRRLRPILMTALTTSVGLLPLALGLGEGGEAQAPMARAVIGGLLSASLITLVFVPVVYSVFESKLRKKEDQGGNIQPEKA